MLQVRDAADRGGRQVGGGAGVGRVPARVLDQPRIGEEPAGQPGQRLPGRAGEEVGQAGLAARHPGQVQGAGQERPLTRGPAPFPPLEIALPGLALARREPLHLRGHRTRIAARVQDAAVREVIPAHRIDLGQGDQVVQLAARFRGQRAEEVRQGEQGGAEPEREAIPAQFGQLAAELVAALEQLDPVSPGGQADRGGHAAHPAADHHDITHRAAVLRSWCESAGTRPARPGCPCPARRPGRSPGRGGRWPRTPLFPSRPSRCRW